SQRRSRRPAVGPKETVVAAMQQFYRSCAKEHLPAAAVQPQPQGQEHQQLVDFKNIQQVQDTTSSP
ncbi:unnamed protein product, partial [Amoebophrya sp. A25]